MSETMPEPVASVTVVFDDHLASDDLRKIVDQSPAWVVGSERNRALAEELWPGGRGLKGILSFFVASPDDLASVLAQIDEHMEDVGWDRAENQVDLIGCVDMAACEEVLVAAGFQTIVRKSGALAARRPRIRRPSQAEFDEKWGNRG
jgi:hypothetical protein